MGRCPVGWGREGYVYDLNGEGEDGRGGVMRGFDHCFPSSVLGCSFLLVVYSIVGMILYCRSSYYTWYQYQYRDDL